MKIGIKRTNGGVLMMKRRKFAESGGITLPKWQQIKQTDKENGYKYLGILEADKMKDN